jgi:DNA-binding CsgD family transcriptional regulator
MSTLISFGTLKGSTGVLAEKELKTALAVCAGLANKEIARELQCSPSTIKKCIERLFYKLDVSSRSAIPMELFRRGIVAPALCLMLALLVCLQQNPNAVRRPSAPRRVETFASVRRIETAVEA